MNQDGLIVSIDQDFQNSRNDGVGGLHGGVFVWLYKDSMMGNVPFLEESFVSGRVGLFNECPAVYYQYRCQRKEMTDQRTE